MLLSVLRRLSVVVDFLFIVTPIVGVCNCSMFCCTLLYVHSSIAIILIGKRGLVALLNLSSWCLVTVEWLFLAVTWGCLRFGIVVFPDHTHLLFLRHRSVVCSIVFFSFLFDQGYIIWITQYSNISSNLLNSERVNSFSLSVF